MNETCNETGNIKPRQNLDLPQKTAISSHPSTMKTFLLFTIALAFVAVISGFVQSDHSQGHDAEGEGHHHHHHHKHHHKKHHHKHHHHHHHHQKCKGEGINSNNDLIKAKQECNKEFQEDKENNVEDRFRGRTCKSLCAGRKIGAFDEEGQIVQAKLDELIESIIESSEAQLEIKDKAVECANNHTAALTEGPKDVKCSNYKPYFSCLFKSTLEVCVKGYDPEDFE